METRIAGDVFEPYLKSLIDGDRATCARLIRKLLKQNIDIRDIYINLFQKSMYRIGTLWEKNRISIAVEHLATSITENLLALVYPTIFSTSRIGKNAVICCVKNEYHQIGGKMVADIFELNGWDSYFLGANTPLESLIGFINQKKPQLIGISMSLPQNRSYMVHVIQSIQNLSGNLEIIVGGQAFTWGALPILDNFPQVRYIAGIHDLEKVILKKGEAMHP
jgi:methanogenic corrinoid protein MtbC1